MSGRRGWQALLVAVLLLAGANSALAQVGATVATLNGTVRDETGALVVKASITLRELDTNRTYSAVSSGAGFYVVPNVAPGRYELKVSSASFATFIRTGILLSVGQTATIDINLRVAGKTEEMVVSGEAQAIEPTRTEISQVIGTEQIKELPVSGRLFTDFALLTPGVATGRTSLGTTFTEFEITQISFGGQRSFTNIITVDGADFINSNTGVQRATPPQESVQEFRVVNNKIGRASCRERVYVLV